MFASVSWLVDLFYLCLFPLTLSPADISSILIFKFLTPLMHLKVGGESKRIPWGSLG